MTVTRYNNHVDTGGDPVMIASPHGQYVAIEDYEHLLIEKTQLATKTEALLHSLGTAKFTVHGSDIVCTESGVLGGSAHGMVYGDSVVPPSPTVEIRDIDFTKMYNGDEDEDSEPPTAPDILEAGAKHMRDRAVLYDQPGGERSMAHAVGVFEALTGITLTAQDGWLFMVILKLVRAQKNPDHMDNYEDACAYVALLAEEQAGDL